MSAALKSFREHFPILEQQIGSSKLVYLDSAATSQKPLSVINAESNFYKNNNANVHRAPHELSERSTEAYEQVREKVKNFLNAASSEEIIFTKGTTQSINLVAQSLSQFHINSDSEIVLTELEHHSNIVPWQIIAHKVGAKILPARVQTNGEIDLKDFEHKLSEKTSVVSFASVSNALGTAHPIEKMIMMVRKKSPRALILIDAAQSVSHMQTDVRALDVDFLVFSAHKLYGPTGVGVLYGKKEVLESMPPVEGGGDMIERVSFSGTTYARPPFRFEAGTPNIAGVVSFGAALDFIQSFPWNDIEAHELNILNRFVDQLSSIEKVKIIGKPQKRSSAVSFVIEGMSPLDVAVSLNRHGIAVRAGHHCCMPLMESLGLIGTVRVSWAGYTTEDEIERFGSALKEVIRAHETNLNQDEALFFAPQSASSIQQAMNEARAILNNAGEFRSEVLLELAGSHPRRLQVLRKIAPEIPGCMSEVRLVTKVEEHGKLFIASDSNSEIVRGLLSLVEKVFSGQHIEEIQKYDYRNLFLELDLPGFISVQRRSGLESVLRSIFASPHAR